ncbi:MAG: LPS-assembly protein LptD [Variibacter sp.]
MTQRRDSALVVAILAVFIAIIWSVSAYPQTPAVNWVGVPQKPPSQVGTASGDIAAGRKDPTAQMLVQANEIQYDYANERVAAVGRVQIHYRGSVLEADRVLYNQRTKRLHAEGNVRLTESDGKIINAERLELGEDFRDGFVDSLQVETGDKTYIAASRADRREDKLTVFRSGVYTACEPCKDNPKAPPKWQVKAARILHDENEKTIYFEDARLEFFGFPVAYFPYFWTPDPTVKKKSGFLIPSVISGNKFGFGVQVPYFFNLAPDYDLTVAPMYTTRQGLLMYGEWRQHLINGAYNIRAAGIFQQDRGAFTGTSGDRDFRGGIQTKGDFRLSEKWSYGWSGAVVTDNTFIQDYRALNPGDTAIVSQAYLFGRGDRSYFDARLLHFYGLSPIDIQKQLPVVHPLIDYKYVFDRPVFGGELGFNVNVLSLSRQQADFDPVTQAALNGDLCNSNNPAAILNRANCLLRGIPGTYSRASAEVYWKRTFVDPYGQMFTPFVQVRGDLAQASITNQPGVSNFIQTGDNTLARVMPAVGVEYRYPFISSHSWGTQTIEPIVQFIARPNETQIGRFPNEDAQSLVFDDANLFQISKFSGWDRVEGGGRLNAGVQYTAQFDKFGYFNALFGQSYHLFGTNSYAVGDMANVGIASGLQNDVSDYVARATFQPNQIYSFTSRFRFDEKTFDAHRMEFETRFNFNRWSASVTYGQYDAQTSASLLIPREAIASTASFKITPNWSIGGSTLYSIDSNRLAALTANVGYVDECFAINAIFVSNYGYRGDIVPNRVFLLQISLRTLGGTTFQQTIGGPGGGTGYGL